MGQTLNQGHFCDEFSEVTHSYHQLMPPETPVSVSTDPSYSSGDEQGWVFLVNIHVLLHNAKAS